MPNPYPDILTLPANKYFASEFDREKVPSAALRKERGLAISLTRRDKTGIVIVSQQHSYFGGQPFAFVSRDDNPPDSDWQTIYGFGSPRVSRQPQICSH